MVGSCVRSSVSGFFSPRRPPPQAVKEKLEAIKRSPGEEVFATKVASAMGSAVGPPMPSLEPGRKPKPLGPLEERAWNRW
jgi:hypothetical protein